MLSQAFAIFIVYYVVDLYGNNLFRNVLTQNLGETVKGRLCSFGNKIVFTWKLSGTNILALSLVF
jgi:hypothetical protein